MLLAGDLTSEPDLKTEVVLGDLPAALLEDDLERVQSMIDARHNLAALRKVSQNGYKLFSRTRHAAAKESHTRSRALIEESPVGSSRLGVHPVFAKFVGEAEKERVDLLDQLRNFRPAETIFEFKKMGLSKASSETDATMKARRAQLDGTIARRKEKKATAIVRSSAASRDTNASSTVIADADEEDIDAAFGTVFGKKRARPTSFRDEEFYIPHTQPSNDGTETAYAVNTGAAAEFLRQASSAEMGMTGDDARDLANAKRAAMGSMKWDSKKRRYIRETLGRDNKKLIRTDSGAMLPASYKTNMYVSE